MIQRLNPLHPIAQAKQGVLFQQTYSKNDKQITIPYEPKAHAYQVKVKTGEAGASRLFEKKVPESKSLKQITPKEAEMTVAIPWNGATSVPPTLILASKNQPSKFQKPVPESDESHARRKHPR